MKNESITLELRHNFVSMNEVIGRNHFLYEKYKKDLTHKAAYCFRSLAKKFGVKTIEKPTFMVFVWYYAEKKNAIKTVAKDPDNIAFNIKAILDGLVKAKVIKNDTYEYTKYGTLHIPVIVQNPNEEKVVITIFTLPLDKVMNDVIKLLPK